jgi:hypothetical protein
MLHNDYIPTTKWTIGKHLQEEDSLNLLFISYGRTWTYPRQIISIWDKSSKTDKGRTWENEVGDKLCYMGTRQPIKYATCMDDEELFTKEQDIIVHTSWNFIFETKEEADLAFRKILSQYRKLLEQTIATEHEMILQARQALDY